ncbi:hypothetical protein X975_06412, partial [Stegodyphus mimosarum]
MLSQNVLYSKLEFHRVQLETAFFLTSTLMICRQSSFMDPWTQVAKQNAKLKIEKTLNEALVILESWCEKKIYVGKLDKNSSTDFLLYAQILPEIFYQGSHLTNNDKCTYLGVVFDNKLSWVFQIESFSERTEKRLEILKCLASCLWSCSRLTLTKHIKL